MLEKTIEVILEELEKNPQEKLKRPPYPVKAMKKNNTHFRTHPKKYERIFRYYYY